MQPPPSTSAIGDLDIIRQALQWTGDGHDVALATVIETWGSAPRPAGSQMVINSESAFAGSVSGGCIEGEAVTEAHGVIRTQRPKVVEFQVTDEMASGAGLACGGKVRVLISAVSGEAGKTLHRLLQGTEEKHRAALVFDLETGLPALHQQTVPERSGIIERPDGSPAFARVYDPPSRLLITGAVHIAQFLCILGKQADYDVTVIDPRDTWGTAERFPDVTIDKHWPSTALEDLAPDQTTAVVALCHDAKLDDPAVITALKSRAFYIGALGSRKTHAKRIRRLQGYGLTEAEISRLHAPVGLDIGADTPFEIAVSIMAQIIAVHRQN